MKHNVEDELRIWVNTAWGRKSIHSRTAEVTMRMPVSKESKDWMGLWISTGCGKFEANLTSSQEVERPWGQQSTSG